MLDLKPASFDDFLREAKRGNVIPVVRSVLADLQTPVRAFMRIAEGATYAFMLESVEGGERVARYSFLSANPEMIVRGRGNDTHVERAGGSELLRNLSATDFARTYFKDRELARRSGLAPLAGGAVGYLAYEAARWSEPSLEAYFDRDLDADDAVWMFYRTMLAFDRVRQSIEITAIVLTEEARGSHERLKRLYQRAVAETARIERLLNARGSRSADAPVAGNDAFKSNWTRSEFEDAVRSVQQYIAAGDCYHVVLSQRLSKEVNVDPVQIYRALRTTNPSPYMYFFRLGRETVIGSSSEMLVRCRGQRLDHRPVAGTRRRGATETEDWLLGEEMRTDENEAAEHTMLVDLGRNDLGRVADYASVEIENLMAVEGYSNAQHLVTRLRARLRDNLDRLDALASCFPGGTVTGAPKLRAMEIIRELEPDSRGLYGGAILYMDYAKNLDSCIANRTIVVREGRAYVQAGAGIGADSVPAREYDEALHRARALVRAVEMAEKGL